MKVLVAIDDSPYSDDLSDAIVKRKWPEDTQFRVLTVVEPMDPQLTRELRFSERQEIAAKRKQHAEHMADKMRHKLMEHVPHCSVHFEVRQGEPQAEIIESATDWQADSIMLGAKGRQICPHYLLGSVSRGVATHAGCSVEIVRKPDYAGKEKTATTCAGKSKKH